MSAHRPGPALKEATKVIAGAAKQSRWLQAVGTLWKLDRQALEIDSILYTAALSACDRSRQWSAALDLVTHVLAEGVLLLDQGLNYLALACQKASEWQRLLHLLVKPCRPDDSLAHEVGFTAGLEAFPHWTQALSLWRAMPALRAPSDATALSALVTALRPAAEWARAVSLLSIALAFSAQSADVALCNAVCTTCEARQEWTQAVEVLRKMLAADLEPDMITFSAIISACEADGQWAFALYAMQDMQVRQLMPNLITYNATIAACSTGSWEHALRILKSMASSARDVVSYNSVLASELPWQMCVQLLEEMQAAELAPDALTYNSVMEALDGALQWRVAVRLLMEMPHPMADAITCRWATSVCEKAAAHAQARLNHVQGIAYGFIEELQ
ncbi:unnamed protein product [Durusdinium trenchii]|uniref:Pentatricopeptide repeat-containing protein, chloroplastic n=1 Tax=Durusdinium trenchii TaxID=1381693 RepID=A0ABP0QXS3_9DINO